MVDIMIFIETIFTIQRKRPYILDINGDITSNITVQQHQGTHKFHGLSNHKQPIIGSFNTFGTFTLRLLSFYLFVKHLSKVAILNQR